MLTDQSPKLTLQPALGRQTLSVAIIVLINSHRLWLTELSDALPAQAQLHGLDISCDQYPPKEWVSENVSLHEHDAFKPFAPEFLGSFDLLNLRFFVTLLSGENIATVPLGRKLSNSSSREWETCCID
ncbi:hypothetical protein GGR56DRAFT_651784 [Xylariaceae sp. FL0804]|nr:hypothetical protein GGR56DRAFT_651784 [Xylariaceae sp. FL0804]